MEEMKTLAVCYSKTGTTKTVADAIVVKYNCDLDTLQYDESTKTISSLYNPADYERVILLSPIWGFTLADPMKLYVNQYKDEIKKYFLIVTYMMFGLKGCVKECVSAIGKPPENAVKLHAKDIKKGSFDIDILDFLRNSERAAL